MWDKPDRERNPTALRFLTGSLFDGMYEIGRATKMITSALAMSPGVFYRKRPRQAWFAQMYTAGIGSLGVISVVALFTGMIFALQIGIELRRFNQESLVGAGVMVTMLREMGPFMSGLVLASCVGSAMAAQIGMMTVNEEIAALQLMSISPVRFLATPRIMALIVMGPLLSFYTCVLGVYGGAVVSVSQFHLTWSQYFTEAMSIASNKALYVGLLKAMIFGIIIAGVSCYEGFTATGGAVGVGTATRNSVVRSFLLILVSGYILTRFFY